MEAIRSGLRCSTIEAIFATIHLVLTQGVILTNYVLDLGASNMLCSVVESLPFFVQFSYFLSPLLVRRLNQRKPVAVFFSVTHRLSWLVLIALLFIDLTSGVNQIQMVLTLLCANVCAVIAGNAWFSWMTDLVPPAIRGSYYGRRNAYLGLTSLIALWIGTNVLSLFRDVGMGPVGYTLCFTVAILSALYAARMLYRQYEPPPRPVPAISLKKLFAIVNERDLLKKYIKFATLWQFSLGISAAFFGVQMVRVLKMSPALMGYQALLSSMMALGGSWLWGKARDRIGDRPVLIASGAIIALHVWIWMPAAEGFLWPVWIASGVGGFCWAGFNITVFSWPQKFCGREDRQYTFGLLGFISGPAFVMGSLLGGALTTLLPQVLFRLGSFEVSHFHLVFALSSIGRFVAIQLIARWSKEYDPGARTIPRCVKDTFREMIP
jgi:MFS family permease